MAKGDKKKGKKKKAGGKKKADGELDKETIAKLAVAAAKVWEAKYTATEDSRQTYRENAMKLVDENEALQTSVYKTEQDTIEVIAFLKKEEALRNEEVKELKQQLKESQVQAAREREHLTRMYEGKITTLDHTLEERDHEVATLQEELELLKDFRTSKATMEREMSELSERMEVMASEHKRLVSKMEERFMEEKHRLQKEANRQVAGLAQKAHDMAVKNLDQKTRGVYRENVQLAEALSLHLKDAEGMRKMLEQYRAQNDELKLTKEFNEEMTTKHVTEAANHKKVIKELQSKVKSLESTLGKMLKEFEGDKDRWIRKCQDETHQLQCEVAILRRNAQLQAKEANHVKLLAKQLLDKRTDVEEFFITALTEVRHKAKETQSQYRQAAQEAYQHKLSEASRGSREFPPVRTFRPMPNSTNSVYDDIERGRSWQGVESSQVDLSDLTWEQKEQVLRLLFAQVNGRSNIPKLSPRPEGMKMETALVPVPTEH